MTVQLGSAVRSARTARFAQASNPHRSIDSESAPDRRVRIPRRSWGKNDLVPVVDVTYSSDVSDGELQRLAELLPDLIAEAVDCPEEPWTGPACVGDIEIRFRRQGDFDVGELRVAIELRTKLFDSRLTDKQRRADLVRDGLSSLDLGHVGVWLVLHEGAWSQT